MKKFIDHSRLALGMAVVSGIAFHLDAGTHLLNFLKSVASKLLPWLSISLFS